MREMISNLYKNKMGEKKSQNIRKKMMKCNGKVESSGEMKRQKGKVWGSEKVGESVTVNVDCWEI